MRRLLHGYRIGLACLALALLLGLAAIVDHRNKTARSNRAELSEWYCTNTGTRCGGASSAAIERHWNQRELGYEVAVTLLGAFGAASVVRAIRH